ncbi:MAG: PhnD/SsuA/transferrin family substrate-binding protein [Propionibacteriales bacterium]|nr:PhnD/SsuA/transferrin family substrate-binding protein [Propionibacteriales bacterium]
MWKCKRLQHASRDERLSRQQAAPFDRRSRACGRTGTSAIDCRCGRFGLIDRADRGVAVSTRLVVGAFTPSVLLAVARRSGRLDEHGLEVEEVPVPSSPAQFRALLAGELDVAFTSPDNVLAYRFSPSNPLGAVADVRIVSSVDRGLGLGLYGRPGLERADQLRGAVLGVDVSTSGFALAMYALADSMGVGRDAYELVALGSTPRRVTALLAGECDATMLNAGNELIAEQAGCACLATVADVCAPYLGTVLSVAGDNLVGHARTLATALRLTAGDLRAGRADAVAVDEAGRLLQLPTALAERYVDRLKSPDEGLIGSDEVDLEGLATIVELRRRFLPETVDGVDVLDRALDPASGLVASPAGAAT